MPLCRCSICLDGIEESRMSALTCGHIFHYDCISNWLTRTNRCPICRVPAFAANIIKQLFLDAGQPSSSTDHKLAQEMQKLRDQVAALTEENKAIRESIKAALDSERHSQAMLLRNITENNNLKKRIVEEWNDLKKRYNAVLAENQALKRNLNRLEAEKMVAQRKYQEASGVRNVEMAIQSSPSVSMNSDGRVELQVAQSPVMRPQSGPANGMMHHRDIAPRLNNSFVLRVQATANKVPQSTK